MRAEVLDHHFVIAHHLVDMQRNALLGTADHHHHASALRAVGRAHTGLQQRAQPEKRERLVDQGESTRCIRFVDLYRCGAAHYLHQGRRDCHLRVTTPQHHNLGDCRGQRQDHLERGALTRSGGGLDAPAHRDHVGAHHIHAHAPACQFGQTLRSREAGHVNQIRQFLDRRLCVLVEQALGDRLVANARQVESTAVVTKLHGDLVALVRQRNGDRAGGVLARCATRLWYFDPMDHAVAQQVFERSGHAVQHGAVDFDGAAHDVQPH